MAWVLGLGGHGEERARASGSSRASTSCSTRSACRARWPRRRDREEFDAALPDLARAAFADPSIRTNPRIPLVAELVELLTRGTRAARSSLGAVDLATALQEAGGVAAGREHAARLRALLGEELARGARDLGATRSGYETPVTVAFADGLAALPVAEALRADPGAASERAWLLVAAAIGALVEAGGAELAAGRWEGRLVLAAPGADAELAALAFDEQVAGIDRLRARALALPPVVEPDDVRAPANPAVAVAERVARRGGHPADQDAVEELGEELARPHDDPDPALRAARRMLQRLRGMGKWGGYHTEFAHLAKGFPGHERALALEVGEALVASGLLAEKPSVGQRHVYLDPRHAAEIHGLIDRGELPASVRLPG